MTLLSDVQPRAVRRGRFTRPSIQRAVPSGASARPCVKILRQDHQCPASSSRSNTPARATAAGRSRRTRAPCRASSMRAVEQATGTRDSSSSMAPGGPTRASTRCARSRTSICRVPSRPRRWCAASTTRCPPTSTCLRVDPVPHRFHARHDAVARSYLYQLARRRTAFAKPFVWWVKEPLSTRRDARGGRLLRRPCTTSGRSPTMTRTRSRPRCCVEARRSLEDGDSSSSASRARTSSGRWSAASWACWWRSDAESCPRRTCGGSSASSPMCRPR